MDEIIAALTDNRALFDAVEAGTATDDECHTVQEVVAQVRGFLTTADNRAEALPGRRALYFSLLPDAKRAEVETAISTVLTKASLAATPATPATP